MERLLATPAGVDTAALHAASLAPSAAAPAEELGSLVGWAAAIFYLAESDVNPGVASYWDALHYVTTALSVGYANIFPVTPLGKTVGSVVMMLGPALSARVLDTARERQLVGAPPLDLSPVLERLDAILHALHARNPSGGDAGPP
ncbi:MAG: potassium channel family protein [Deltaproteobacteria bacterium]